MTTTSLSYEEKVAELEEILRRLDDAETPIETLANDVKKGALLIKELDTQLRHVESQVRDAFAELQQEPGTEAPSL